MARTSSEHSSDTLVRTLGTAQFVAAMLGALVFLIPGAAAKSSRPNVVLIITDDQGHGDLGLHGNPILRTPNLDRLGREGVRFDYFYVSPVCAPTRASLLTGRYNYRTGVTDTYRGRALMHPDELTLAEMLRRAGYRTGIFGKWHLGDNYPLRSMDQGFEESLVHLGGGIGQPSDPPGGTNYFDPILQHNGKMVKKRGYCSDLYTEAAIKFMMRHRARPFFVYLSFNAPHTPLLAPKAGYETYRKLNLAHDQFPAKGHPLPGKADEEMIAKVYSMVSNIDDNIGRLLAELDELKLTQNTIIIFLTDNGPQGVRYNSGLRGRKASVYEGGIRVPCFIRWPAKFPGGRNVSQIAAHIDVTPTLLEACRVREPRFVKLDGWSLLPLLEGRPVDWPARTLYFQWHRGDVPERYRAFAARNDLYKLVQPETPAETNWNGLPVFQLFDMANDPLEMRDVAAEHPGIVQQLRKGYETWFKDVGGTRGFDPVRIQLGTSQENPTTLTRQDWRGLRADWTPAGLGYWEVDVRKRGSYDIALRFAAARAVAPLHLELRDVHLETAVVSGETRWVFPAVQLPEGPARLRAWLSVGGTNVGVNFVDLKRTR